MRRFGCFRADAGFGMTPHLALLQSDRPHVLQLGLDEHEDAHDHRFAARIDLSIADPPTVSEPAAAEVEPNLVDGGCWW